MSSCQFPTCFSNILKSAALCLLATLTVQATAQPRSFDDCQNIADRTARYVCYDQVEGTSEAPTRGEVVTTIPATSPPAAAESVNPQAAVAPAEESRKPFYRRLLPFGAGDDDQAQTAGSTAASAANNSTDDDDVENFGRGGQSSAAHVENSADGKGELVDSIASLKLVQYNTWEITLSSGQVWRQMINRRYPLKAGDQVRLQSTGFGSSYRLSAERLDGSGFIQVERVDN